MFRTRDFILRMTVWYSVLCMHQAEKCVPYAIFYLRDCVRIIMCMIYRNNRNVCVCVCVCECVCVCVCVCVGGWMGVCGLRTVCDVTSHNVWQRTVKLIPDKVTCFFMSELVVLVLRFFAYSNSISPSFFLLTPFYDTLSRPAPLPRTCELLICSYLSSSR